MKGIIYLKEFNGILKMKMERVGTRFEGPEYYYYFFLLFIQSDYFKFQL